MIWFYPNPPGPVAPVIPLPLDSGSVTTGHRRRRTDSGVRSACVSVVTGPVGEGGTEGSRESGDSNRISDVTLKTWAIISVLSTHPRTPDLLLPVGSSLEGSKLQVSVWFPIYTESQIIVVTVVLFRDTCPLGFDS